MEEENNLRHIKIDLISHCETEDVNVVLRDDEFAEVVTRICCRCGTCIGKYGETIACCSACYVNYESFLRDMIRKAWEIELSSEEKGKSLAEIFREEEQRAKEIHSRNEGEKRKL